MKFEGFLKKEAKVIEDNLKRELQLFKKTIKDKKLVSLFDQFILSCQGGKRIRGVLVKIGYEIAGGKGSLEIYKAAVAFEIFQTAILAHDDIIDQSPIRRGRPSLYKSVGNNQALVLADIGFFLSNTLIDNPKAAKFFNKAMINTGLGQLLDTNKSQTIQTYELKTAWYTFIGPLSLGAILGGANEKLLKNLEVFGKNLGIAYQIQDDILDGDPVKTGALNYYQKAEKLIMKITNDKKIQKLLQDLIEYLRSRTR